MKIKLVLHKCQVKKIVDRIDIGIRNLQRHVEKYNYENNYQETAKKEIAILRSIKNDIISQDNLIYSKKKELKNK